MVGQRATAAEALTTLGAVASEEVRFLSIMLATLEHKLEDLARWAQVGRSSHVCVEAERQIACIDQKYTDWSNAQALLPLLQDLMVDDIRYRIEVLLAHARVYKAEISHREAHARCYAICNSAASADPDRQERKEELAVLEDARLVAAGRYFRAKLDPSDTQSNDTARTHRAL